MIKASGAGGRKDSSAPLSIYALLRRKERLRVSLFVQKYAQHLTKMGGNPL